MFEGLSDDLVSSSIAVYAAAFVAYAVHLSRTMIYRRFGARRLPSPAPAMAASGHPSGRDVHAGTGLAPAPVAGRRSARLAVTLVAVGFAFNVLAVVTRGVAAGRAPWGNMYEFAIVGAAAIVAAYLVARRFYGIEDLGVWVVGAALVVLGCAVTVLYTSVDQLIPILNSYWLVIHVGAAIVAGGAFTVAAIASGASLVQRRRERRQEVLSIEQQPSEVLDRLSYGVIIFAFPIWTFAVIAGAVWAEAAWGRYWGWDPKETWAFITWVLYAAYLHAQATVGWRGARAAWLSLLGYAAFLFNFIGVNMWVGGLHSYAGI